MMNRISPAAQACALFVLSMAGCGSTVVNAVSAEPVVLAIIDLPIDGVAKNDTHLYWSDSKGLARVPLARGPIERLPHTVSHFAVDDTSVYFTSWAGGNNAVMKAPLQGGEEVTLAELGWQVDGSFGALVAVNGSAVYFGDDNGVKSVPIDGGEVTTLSAGWPGGMALDATSLYWTDPGDGTVKRRPLDGSEQETVLATGLAAPTEPAVGGATLCWVSEGHFHRASKEDGSGAEITLGMGMLSHIAADAEYAYGVDDTSDELRRTSLAGGEVVTLVTLETHVLYLAVDDAGVYWIRPWDEHRAAVVKLPK